MTKIIKPTLPYNIIDSKIFGSNFLIGAKKLTYFFLNAKYIKGFRKSFALYSPSAAKLSLKKALKLTFVAKGHGKSNDFIETTRLPCLNGNRDMEHILYKLVGSKDLRHFAFKLSFFMSQKRKLV